MARTRRETCPSNSATGGLSAVDWLGRIDKAARTHGSDSAEVARRVRRLFTIFRFDTALLLLIVLDMAAKPSF